MGAEYAGASATASWELAYNAESSTTATASNSLETGAAEARELSCGTGGGNWALYQWRLARPRDDAGKGFANLSSHTWCAENGAAPMYAPAECPSKGYLGTCYSKEYVLQNMSHWTRPK